MKLVIYYPWVYLKGGAERLLLELMQRSRHDWTLYTNRYDADVTFSEFKDLPIIELPRVSIRRNVKDVALAGTRLLFQRLPFKDADALMVCMESLGNLITFRTRRVPTFCMCLTPLRVAFDPRTHERFLASNPSLLSRLAVAAYARVDRLAWRHYEKVFCISKEVAARVRNARLVNDDRIEVIYPGVDLDHFEPSDASEPFFLLPGRIMWTKNIELGIEAFGLLKDSAHSAEGFHLVVAGIVDRKSQPYLEKLQAMASGIPDVDFVINPSDEEYKRLHQRCYGVLFTAFNEDWGLVPLEGMACAKPVIAVAQGGPLETVVHGETGFLCPPEPEAFSRAMQEMVEKPEMVQAMGVAGRSRAAMFSWESFVSRIDEFVVLLTQDHEVPIERASFSG
jgi:glycosyltransferase involved in cell wall biosynthesis